MMHGYLQKRSGRKMAGHLMVGVGFLMILVTALAYVLGWSGEFTPLLIIGLVLSVTGLNVTRSK
jgi:hypothetical protein